MSRDGHNPLPPLDEEKKHISPVDPHLFLYGCSYKPAESLPAQCRVHFCPPCLHLAPLAAENTQTEQEGGN